jgi:hypothetical protein
MMTSAHAATAHMLQYAGQQVLSLGVTPGKAKALLQPSLSGLKQLSRHNKNCKEQNQGKSASDDIGAFLPFCAHLRGSQIQFGYPFSVCLTPIISE